MVTIVISNHLERWYDVPNINKHLVKLKQRAQQLKSKITNIKSIVVPHAGIQYSGLAMMSTYISSYRPNIKRIILLSTDHQNLLGFNFINANSIITKNNSEKFKVRLENSFKNRNMRFIDSSIIQNEHSLLNQIPFIDFLYGPRVTVMPIIVGKITMEESEIMAQQLSSLMGTDTLVVCSTDFNHINGRFQHKITPPNIQRKIKKADSLIVRLLNDKRDFVENIRKHKLSPCGIYALKLLQSINLIYNYSRCNVCCYYTSNNTFNTPYIFDELFSKKNIKDISNSSVSYVGLLFSHHKYIKTNVQRPLSFLLTPFEKKALVNYSYLLLNNYLMGKNIDSIVPFYCPVFYKVKLGTFVTIKTNDNKLRGCIGTLSPEDNILNNIKKYTYSSAFEDSRFKPLSMSEFIDKKTNSYLLTISISLLNELKPISYEEYKSSNGKFKFQEDGILMTRKNGTSAFFLPSVAQDYNFSHKDSDKMLFMLCEKKGIKTHSACFTGDFNLQYNEGIEFK